MAAEVWDCVHEYAGDTHERLLLTGEEALSVTWRRDPRLEHRLASVAGGCSLQRLRTWKACLVQGEKAATAEKCMIS